MTIQLQLRVAILISAGLIAVLGWILFSTFQQVDRATDRGRLADEIGQGVADQKFLTSDFLLHKQARARDQWNIKHDSLTLLLEQAKVEFDDPSDNLVLDTLSQRHVNSKDVFSRLANALEPEGQNGNESTGSGELGERLETQLLIASQEMVSAAFQLAESGRQDIRNAQARALWVVAAFLTAMGIIAVTALLWLTKRILGPIARLRSGAEIIGQGNLDHRIGNTSRDEFGELSRAFDTMVSLRQRAETEREGLLHERGERIKEMTCMYGVLGSIQAHANMEDIARDVVALLPPGWQYPEITAARIRYEDNEYLAGAFEETQWRLAADIVIEDVKHGEVEVYYLEERPPASEGPFLKEERDLIEGIARTLGETGERSQLADQARARQAEAMTAGRLASIGELAAGVAHEINNPINTIINYADLVLEQVGDEGERGRYLQGIIREGERIGSITSNLLTFARDVPQSHSPARVSDIVGATVELFGRRLMSDSIDLRVDVPEDLPQVKCRSQQIQQVFLNLVTNARHALNERYPHDDSDKVLEISADVVDMDGEPGVRVVFHDHGTGIPESALSKVFDPFYSTKIEGEGTGLGLSISHGIIRDHHGRIHFESVEGEYTRAIVDLLVNNGWNLES